MNEEIISQEYCTSGIYNSSNTYDEAGNRTSRQMLNATSLDNDDELLSQVRSKNKSQEKSIIRSEDWKIFPNPVRNKLYVENRSNLDANHLAQVYDLSGKLITEKQFIDISVLDFSTLQSGVYILSVSNEKNEVKYWKIVKH